MGIKSVFNIEQRTMYKFYSIFLFTVRLPK